MRSVADKFALVEYQYSVCIHYAADALRYYYNIFIRKIVFKRPAQSRVGFKIKRGKTIVEYVHGSFFKQSTRNRDTLFLTARNICAAL